MPAQIWSKSIPEFEFGANTLKKMKPPKKIII
jgi:hypothetical protein